MKPLSLKLVIATILLFFSCLNSEAQLAQRIPITGDNKLLGLGTYYSIKSEILGEDRPIAVSLPDGYDESGANYPVLYLMDGMGNIKHQVGTMMMLTEAGFIPPTIIVAVESLDRARDLTPSKGGQGTFGSVGNGGIAQSGGAAEFLEFIEQELIPHIESTYRTHPFRILEGHSFGGLFTTYALMEKTDLFDAYIVQSPAMWWNKEEMTVKAKTFFPFKEILNKAVYFGIGADDGWGMRQELLRYVEVIKNNEPRGLHWMNEEIPDEGHDSARLLLNYHGLKFIFSELRISQEIHDNYTDKAFLEREARLVKKYGSEARGPVTDYARLAIKLMSDGNDLGAITVFERAAEAYPKYFDLLTTIARLYEKTGQINKAIATFERSIKISNKLKLGMKDNYQKEIDRLKRN